MSDAMFEENMRVIREEVRRGPWGAPTLPPVPNSPKTPLRNFRIPDVEYVPAQAKAREEGTDLTKVVRALLRDWIAK